MTISLMKFSWILCLLVGFISCGEPSAPTQADISAQKTPSTVDVMKDFMSLTTIDARIERYEQAIKANIDAGRKEQAIDIYRNVVVHHDSDDMIQAATPILLKHLKSDEDTEAFISALSSAFVTEYPQHSYTSNHLEVPPISDELERKAELINNPNFNRFSRPDAMDYIDMSEAYMMVSPRTPAAGANLMKAANLAKSIPGYGAKAVALYNWLLEKQPDHPKAPQALFLKAFTLDNELGEDAKAKVHYEAFLKHYPDDVFAKDAELLLKNLGKSDEELLESILKKGGDKK